MQLDGWLVFPVGTGLGVDYNFMDRLARLGNTADDEGESPRGSGNPAEYEQRMTGFLKISIRPKFVWSSRAAILNQQSLRPPQFGSRFFRPKSCDVYGDNPPPGVVGLFFAPDVGIPLRVGG